MSDSPRPTPRHTRPRLHGLINLAVLGLVLWANALAGSGALSGESIGLIANRYASTFLPAGWVFSIWSLISSSDSRTCRRTSPPI